MHLSMRGWRDQYRASRFSSKHLLSCSAARCPINYSIKPCCLYVCVASVPVLQTCRNPPRCGLTCYRLKVIVSLLCGLLLQTSFQFECQLLFRHLRRRSFQMQLQRFASPRIVRVRYFSGGFQVCFSVCWRFRLSSCCRHSLTHN